MIKLQSSKLTDKAKATQTFKNLRLWVLWRGAKHVLGDGQRCPSAAATENAWSQMYGHGKSVKVYGQNSSGTVVAVKVAYTN